MKFLFQIPLFLIISFFNTSVFGQIRISGVILPNSVNVNNTPLILNGAGVRTKYFMDMYVGGLYLPVKSKDPQKIINANELMAIRIHIVSSLITSQKMEDAINEGFKKSTGGRTEQFKKQITEFIAAFKEDIKQGDIFEIVYTLATVSVIKNNKKVASININVYEFKKVLFGIWLSDKPADEDLKKGILGIN